MLDYAPEEDRQKQDQRTTCTAVRLTNIIRYYCTPADQLERLAGVSLNISNPYAQIIWPRSQHTYELREPRPPMTG